MIFKKMKKAIAACCLILTSCNLYAADNIEQVYDAKIKAIQALPDTYVVAHAIGDFNGDGVKDLMIGKVEKINNDVRLIQLCFTYKNGKIIKIADEMSDRAGIIPWICKAYSGKVFPFGEVMVVTSTDGKNDLLKVTKTTGFSVGVTYYRVGNNMQWETYLESDEFYDNYVVQGYTNSWKKQGKDISKQQYYKEIGYYENAKMLYSYCPSGAICSQADKYNKVNIGIIVNPSEKGKEYEYEIRYSDKVVNGKTLWEICNKEMM